MDDYRLSYMVRLSEMDEGDWQTLMELRGYFNPAGFWEVLTAVDLFRKLQTEVGNSSGEQA